MMKLIDYIVVIALWFLYSVAGLSALVFGIHAVAGSLNNTGIYVYTDSHQPVIMYLLLFAFASGASKMGHTCLGIVSEALND